MKAKASEPITEDEMPFEIPKNWVWIKLCDAINVVSARRVHQSDWKNEGVPFYRAREIAKLASSGYVNNELYISKELYDKFSAFGVPSEGDLMVTAVGTIGKIYVVKKNDLFSSFPFVFSGNGVFSSGNGCGNPFVIKDFLGCSPARLRPLSFPATVRLNPRLLSDGFADAWSAVRLRFALPF